MTQALLQVDRLCSGYSGAVVLNEISLHIDRGETVAVSVETAPARPR